MQYHQKNPDDILVNILIVLFIVVLFISLVTSVAVSSLNSKLKAQKSEFQQFRQEAIERNYYYYAVDEKTGETHGEWR